jgi:hypothetical protein
MFIHLEDPLVIDIEVPRMRFRDSAIFKNKVGIWASGITIGADYLLFVCPMPMRRRRWRIHPPRLER